MKLSPALFALALAAPALGQAPASGPTGVDAVGGEDQPDEVATSVPLAPLPTDPGYVDRIEEDADVMFGEDEDLDALPPVRNDQPPIGEEDFDFYDTEPATSPPARSPAGDLQVN